MPSEWESWSKRYRAVLGLTGADAEQMVGEWAVLLAREGYAPAEAEAATDWLFLHGRGRFRADMLRELLDRLRAARMPPKDAAPEDRLGTCGDCGGTGRVAVPAEGLPTLGGGRFPAGSWAAVTCSCALGRWFAERTGARDAQGGPRQVPMLKLADYEREFPGWRDEAKALRASAARRMAAQQTAGHLDRTLGAVFRRLRARRPGEG
jgi:hypothetical protein